MINTEFYKSEKMPLVGFGTFDLPKDEISQIIKNVYNLGYRKFDTAALYNNEIEIGKALKNNGIKRESVIIQTKLDVPSLYYTPFRYGRGHFLNVRKPRSIASFIEDAFIRLNTDYIDIFLIHGPSPKFLSVYKSLEKFYKEGRIKALGVCSFLPPHLEYLLDNCEVKPVINQFEISPFNTNRELIAYCKHIDIQPEAMSSFAHFHSSVPRKEILQNPILMEIAQSHNKSVAQIVNRWLVQQGISILPKSKNFLHQKENINIFDFHLNDDEMTIIDSMDQGRFLNYDPTKLYFGLPRKYVSSKWFNLG